MKSVENCAGGYNVGVYIMEKKREGERDGLVRMIGADCSTGSRMDMQCSKNGGGEKNRTEKSFFSTAPTSPPPNSA